MDEYRWNYHVPAFGSWGYEEDESMSYTQCFESARQANFARFAYSQQQADVEDRDLYVAGDLYQNNVLTPAVIVVPRRNRRKGGSNYSSNVKGVKKQQQQSMQKKQDWGGYSYDIKEPPSPILSPPIHHHHHPHPKSKPVDEDLYKIPPEFLHVKPKRKKGLGLFSSCLMPVCA